MNKYCGNCGAELNEGQDVCIKCGKKVNNEEVTAVVNKHCSCYRFCHFYDFFVY